MSLVNRTPLPAHAFVGASAPRRLGVLVAKATFVADAEASVQLVTDDPVPILHEDAQTELGVLPRDDQPHPLDRFEVMLLGYAYAPALRPAPCVVVELQVGTIKRTLRVTGDRSFERREGRRFDGRAEPFTRMPLTWDRAFGGTALIHVDRDAVIEVSHPMNPSGRGFDAAQHAARLAEHLHAPDGYPVVEQPNVLANLESDDDPEQPVCWAPIPAGTAVASERIFEMRDGEPDRLRPRARLSPNAFLRAHPQWVIPRPAAETRVATRHLTSDGQWTFHLPKLRVVVDYVIGGRSGRRELIPAGLLLLPDQRRFTITYKRQVRLEPGDPRPEFRLRVLDGWRREAVRG